MSYFSFRLTSAQLENGVYVVTLRGELDHGQAPEIDRELEELFDSGARHLVIDLLEVPFLGSSVLRVLLRHSRRIRMNGGIVTLVTDNSDFTRVIDTSPHTHFRIVSTLSTALDDVPTAAPS